MNWRAWSANDWNQVLVNEVFLDLERISSPISRINASNRLLQKCTGDAECRPEEARQAFISALGRTSGEMRKRFRWTGEVKAASAKEKIPSVFAPLYLTLLAASADEATYDEGNFRRRFAELVQPLDIPYLDCNDLPTLWAHVRDWSVQRHRGKKDCRVLHLPAVPDHEKLIGYSKRLAFPTYKDEITLSSVLADLGVDENSGFEVVSRAVYSRFTRFTAGFIEELGQFRALIANGRTLEAYQTPFWGAVRDITWDRRRQEAREIGRFTLDADFSDPVHARLTLLVDEAGHRTLSTRCEPTPFPVPGNYQYLVRTLNGKPCTPAALLSLAQVVARLKQLKLWRDLAAGCLSLFPDEHGNMRSDSSYSDDSAACFIVNSDLARLMQRCATHYGLKPSRTTIMGTPATWEVFLFESISRGSLLGLVRDLPERVQAGMGLAWQPPRPALSGGAWYGQALLLNPASNPIVRMQGAESGKFELLDSQEDTIAQGRLVELDNGGFQIPVSTLPTCPTVAKVRFSLTASESLGDAELDAPLVQTVPFVLPTNLPEPTAWLVDGPSGRLSPFTPVTGNLQSLSPTTPRKEKPGRFHPRFVTIKEQDTWGEYGTSGIDDIPPFLHWLCETLSLRFQSRATLPFKDLRLHVSGAAAAADLPHWLPTRLLLASCWLSTVANRASPYSVVTPAPRTIAIFREGPPLVARIVGMLAQSERAKLRSLLQPGESAYRLTCGGDEPGVGAIELRLSTPSRLKQIACGLGLEVLTRDTFGAPLANGAPVLPAGNTVLPKASVSTTAEKWDGWEWKEYSPVSGAESLGALIRTKGSQRYTHWISTGGSWWKTDSPAWAWLFRATALGFAIGEVASNGDCKLSGQLRGAPPSFLRWWMHWGGGCVSIDNDCCLVFGGAPGMNIWKELGQWTDLTDNTTTPGYAWAAPMDRRRLALRLRRMRNTANQKGE
ncbi:hypothetical protein EDC30_11086 [Paucimonas lemoignei]|uniref:Uncharacterized protein n=1 Tax=Paucimonas lemoignei TaxID=29443 RepID=A0A4R3HR87_PAULE|nr:hypothetical protein EDC30_11086 [Paucimonas lemoignei]